MIKVVVDIGDTERGIVAMLRRSRRLAPAFAELKKPMRDDQRQHQRREEGPDGKWPKRKTAYTTVSRQGAGGRFSGGTKKKRIGSRKKLLGKIPGAIKVVSDDDAVIAFSRIAWASIHQDGGTAGRGAKIPKREFMWISERLAREAQSIISEHMLGGW